MEVGRRVIHVFSRKSGFVLRSVAETKTEWISRVMDKSLVI